MAHKYTYASTGIDIFFLNYLIIYLSGGITHQLKQACFDKTGSQTRCQQWSNKEAKWLREPAAAALFLRRLSCLCAVHGVRAEPLSWGTIWRYERTSKGFERLRNMWETIRMRILVKKQGEFWVSSSIFSSRSWLQSGVNQG